MVNIDDQEDPFASFFGSPTETGTDPQELDSELVINPAVPKVKEKVDMLKETAKRITEARINNVTEKAQLKRDYQRKISGMVENRDLFYGSGTEETVEDED